MMKNLFMMVVLVTAFLSASSAFADDSQNANTQSYSGFEDLATMKNPSEEDKNLKGEGLGNWYFATQMRWYLISNTVWLPFL